MKISISFCIYAFFLVSLQPKQISMRMKTRIFLTMLAVLALSFTACNKKDEPQNPGEDQSIASRLVGKWGFSYRPENLSWELFQRLDLNLFCSQFDFYECDAEGNMIEGTTRTITPADPKLYTYKIFSLTDHYMVLYGTDTNMYYVFTPGHEAPTWAPKQGVNDKKNQKSAKKFGHVRKLL